MKTEQAEFGRRLREGLRRAQMTESSKELVDLIALHGGDVVTPQAAHRWLHGQSIPRRRTLRALAEVLGVSSEWLLGEEPGNPPVGQVRATVTLNPRDRMAMDAFFALPIERRRVVRDLIEILANRK